MAHAELLERDVALPTDQEESRAVAPDGASRDGRLPTIGLPLDSARRPDPEIPIGEDAFARELVNLYREAEAAKAPPRMQISVDGLHLIESFEGFSAVQYLDSVRVPTIGYGTTAADISPLPQHCTRAQAEKWLAGHIQSKYAPAVLSLGVPLNQHQFDALCSFAYNLGPGSMSASWTIGRLLRDRQYRAAADSMLMYDRAGGVVLLGLERRRQAERALFLEPVPKADPHHYSRFIDAKLVDGFNERRTVVAFDEGLAAKRRDVHRLRELQGGIVQLRKRDWAVAHVGAPPVTWAFARRGWRWQELDRRSKVKL